MKSSRRPARLRALRLARSLTSVAVLVLIGAPAGAAVIVVNTIEDEIVEDGDCSLREAIENANQNVPRPHVDCAQGDLNSDLILMALAGTLELAQTLPTVIDALTITLSADLEIVGSGVGRILAIDMPNGTDDFTLTNGTLRSGRTTSAEGGGALLIQRADVVRIEGTHFIDNKACFAIILETCLADSGSPPQNGRGGAIAARGGVDGAGATRVELIGTRFERNVATGSGGAIWLENRQDNNAIAPIDLTVARSDFVANRATSVGGAIYMNTGDLDIDASSFVLHEMVAGTIFAGGSATDPLFRLTNSVIADNVADNRAAIAASGRTFEFWFSTIVRNTNTDGATSSPTISFGGGAGSASHLVIADNVGGDCTQYTSSFIFTSLGYNVDSDGTCGFTHASDLPMQSVPLSGSVEVNGRWVVFPGPSSVLVDGGEQVNNCPGPDGGFVAEDQRGAPRSSLARGGPARCDLGAIERQPEDALLFASGFERGDSSVWQ